MVPPLLAIVDDDDDLRELLDELFSQEGYRTLQVPDSAGAHAALRPRSGSGSLRSSHERR